MNDLSKKIDNFISGGQSLLMQLAEGLSSKDFAHLKSAIDEAAIVAITNNKGTITYANQHFCQISKYSIEELIGQNHRIINSGFHPKQFFIDMWKTISSGQVWEGEIQNRAKDGSFYWVHTTIVPFAGESGKPETYVAVRYDITERKKMETQILQQDRMASLGLLSSSLAHEIGTPLGVIRGRAELADSKAGPNEPLKQDLRIIISQIDRIAKLVDSLLHLARGQESSLPTATDLSHVIFDVANLVQHELSRKGIELRVDVPPEARVKAESGLLGQVFLNLFVNAVHAIESAKKQGKSGPHWIRIASRLEGSRIATEIQDTGCGIPEKNLRQLFQPFFTTKDIGEGTGLGLATSFNIVNSWGGTIAALSAPGEGATFTVSLQKT